MKDVITESDYIRLVGFVTLARDYNAKLRDIVDSVSAIIGEDVDPWTGHGHASDCVYDYENVHTLLRKTDIRVVKELPEEEISD